MQRFIRSALTCWIHHSASTDFWRALADILHATDSYKAVFQHLSVLCPVRRELCSIFFRAKSLLTVGNTKQPHRHVSIEKWPAKGRIVLEFELGNKIQRNKSSEDFALRSNPEQVGVICNSTEKRNSINWNQNMNLS